MFIGLIIKAALAPLIILFLYSQNKALLNQEQQVRQFWEGIFGDIYQIRKQTFAKNSAFKPEYNQSRYNVAESPVYCKRSDAYKMAHPDIVLQDYYIWRDYPPSNLPKRITLDKAFAVLDKVTPTKQASYKYENQLPLQLGFIYTTVSSLFNNYYWGKGLGCVLQKYSHIPGKGSVAMKNQLIDNFMKYTRSFVKKNITNPECKRNASFIPETYRLNDEDDCKAFFETFKTNDYKKNFEKYGPQYIMKTNQHRGEGITVLFANETEALLNEYNNGEKCGTIHTQIIAQRYISNPFLYKGHKIEFRIYYTIISTKPVIAYSYSRALIKRCAKPFSVHSTEKGAHVCNTAIVKNLVKADKDDEEIEDEEFFIDWYLEGLEELLIKQGRAKKGWLQSYLYPKIHRSLIHMTRATYHSFARDSTFGEFFAVDFLLDDNLDVWVLEVNYNPQVLSVTPDRIRRNYKMLEDHFELQYIYLKSKLHRLSEFAKGLSAKERKSILHQSKQVEELLKDKLEKPFELSKENLYVKIMDEGLTGTEAYSNLISQDCLKITSKTFSHIRSRPQSSIVYETKKQEKISPNALKMVIPGASELNDLDKFVLKSSPNKFRTISTRKTQQINESSITQSRTIHTELAKNSPVVQDLAKKIPLSMIKDKDDLYAETVYLKDQINKLTQENYDLKAKSRFLQKNQERMQTVVSNVGGYLQQKYIGDKQDLAVMTKLGISENLLTITLKKQIKELRTLIKQQTAEITNLKHDIKYTKIQELEKQINIFQEETLRLRTLLEQSQRNEQIIQMTHDFNQFEEKFYIQMQIINSLKQENSFFQGQIAMEQEEKFKLQNQIDADQKVLNKQKQVIDDLQQTLKDKQAFIESLESELDAYKDTNQNLIQKANKLDNNQLRIIGLVKTEQELRKELQQKIRDIEYLDKTTTELKQKLNEKSSLEAKIKDQLQDELKKLKIAYEELDEKYKHLLLINAQSRLKETAPSIQQRQAPIAATLNIKTMRPQNLNNTPDSILDKNQQQQKFKVIKKEDVDHLGLELNYRLRTKKITLSDAIEKYLFDNKNKKAGEIKLKEISERLQKEPFLLIDEDSALLVARYLTEDNAQEFVVYNDQLAQSTTIVRSILSKLVGNILIYTQEEENQKTKEIIQTISKYKNSLKQYFDQLPSKYEGLLERKQIIETFEYMDIDLREDQYDFLFLKLFFYSNNTQIFPYIRIFEIFQEIVQIERIDSDKKKKSRKKDLKDDNKNKKIEIFTRRQSMEIVN